MLWLENAMDFQAKPVVLPANPGALEAASIELGASLRYTGTQLRLGDEAIRSAAPKSRAAIGFTSNISKA